MVIKPIINPKELDISLVADNGSVIFII